VRPEEAAGRPSAQWKASADYWRKEAEAAKLRFSQIPFVGPIGVDRLLRLKGALKRGGADSGSPGGEVPRPGLAPDDESRAWHSRALYYETRAKSYGRAAAIFSKPPLGWLDRLWRAVYVKPRMEAASLLLASVETPPDVSPTSGPDLISVVTPTYNRAHTLHRAINSLLGQTYGNWELIVVDDGSTDDTEKLVGSYGDGRIRYIRIDKSGVSRARNIGLDGAYGKYICFLDSDNILDSRFLETMHRAISSSPDEVGLCYCGCTVYMDGYPAGTMERDVTPAALFAEPLIDLGSIICRSEVFSGGLRFDESMDKWVDYELMLRISAAWKFLRVPARLLHYFRLSDGITRAGYAERDMTRNLETIRKTKFSILRVGYVLWDYPALSQSFVHNEIKWLIERGAHVTVFYKKDPDKAAKLDYEVESFRVGTPSEIAGIAAGRGLHLLHTHFAYPAATKLTWAAAVEAGIPFTVMPHAVDIFSYINGLRNRLGRMAASEYARAFFAYGPFHREYMAKRGVPRSKIVLKPNSLDYGWFDTETRPARPVKKVVYVGRYIEKKGLFDIIESAKRVSDTGLAFDMYGYGPLEEKLLAAAEAVPNVTVHPGGIGYSEVMEVMAGSDLFYTPCIRARNGDMDGLPTVFMEAAAMGMPVLTTGISSIPVLIEDGVTGFVCPERDLDCFEARLREIASMPADELSRITTEARRRLDEVFHPDVVNNILVDTWLG